MVPHRGPQWPVRRCLLGPGLWPIPADHRDRRRCGRAVHSRGRSGSPSRAARPPREIVDSLGRHRRARGRCRLVRARPAVQHRGVHTGGAGAVPRWRSSGRCGHQCDWKCDRRRCRGRRTGRRPVGGPVGGPPAGATATTTCCATASSTRRRSTSACAAAATTSAATSARFTRIPDDARAVHTFRDPLGSPAADRRRTSGRSATAGVCADRMRRRVGGRDGLRPRRRVVADACCRGGWSGIDPPAVERRRLRVDRSRRCGWVRARPR